ncbi:hypothetical protein WMO25_02225 [Coprococcus sp. CLA-AA-H190]|uniref:Lin1244/Lin1753-like N-terminal domain-containing protein n=1 Tax=Coprococcus intestinihominis TaxID=3133154 RepID=A0ABV1B1P8_9FIRM
MENVTNWYDTVPYADIKNIIRDRVTAMAREYIGIGFFLRKVRDNEMYLEDGYKDIHDFAMNEFGMSKSTVNHCIRINEQFSIDGNSPGIDERYKDFSKSQLQEMLYIPEDKREDVTPDMTVKEIRSMKEVPLDVEPEVVDEQIPGQMNVYDYPDIVPEQQGPEIRKPSPEEKEILNTFARKLIEDKKAYFRKDYAARVLNVITAEEQLKDNLGTYNRCWYFWNGEEECHINLFDDYIQLWGRSGCIGNFEWFYLMAAVQSMWNVVAMENAERTVRARKDMLVFLTEAVIEKCDLKYEGLDDFNSNVRDTLFAKMIKFTYANTEWIAEFYSDISITNALTGKEIRIRYTWEDLFSELERQGDVGEAYAAEQVFDEDEADDEQQEPEESEGQQVTVQLLLEKEKGKLNQYLDAYKNEASLPAFIEEQKIIVAALAGMVCDLEAAEEPDPEPMELPDMKNNEQRKAFLENYRSWPVWFRVPNAQEVYYRFDLQNGDSIVIREWMYESWKWKETHSTYEYLLKPGYKYLDNCRTNRTALIDYLRGLRKV